jgi:hypothetical protein
MLDVGPPQQVDHYPGPLSLEAGGDVGEDPVPAALGDLGFQGGGPFVEVAAATAELRPG